MTDNVYCTVAEQKQANLAIQRMQLLGYRPEDVVVVDKALDDDTGRSTLWGAVWGFIAGFVFGVGQLAILGHGIWSMWGISMMPLLGGLGWTLVGMIIGSSGLLVSKKTPEKHADSKLVITVPVEDKEKLNVVCAMLKEIGASDIYCTGNAA